MIELGCLALATVIAATFEPVSMRPDPTEPPSLAHVSVLDSAKVLPRVGGAPTTPGSRVGSVVGTLDLLNSTLTSGNVRPINGGGTESIAFVPASGDLYVGGWSLQPVDGTTDSVLGAIPLPRQLSQCAALAFDPTNGLLYATDGESEVVAFNLSSDGIQASVGVGVGPVAITFDPQTGDLYTANSNSSNVSVISGVTNQVVATLPSGVNPVGIAYDSSNGDLYVANADYFGPGNVTVLNATNGSVVGSIAVGQMPSAIAYDARDNRIYVATEYNSSVAIINAANDSLAGYIPVGGFPLALAYDPDSNRVLVVGGGGTDSVAVINASANAVMTTLPTGASPVAIAYDSLDQHLFVVNSNDASLTVLAASNGSQPGAVGTVELSISPRALAIDSADHLLYAADYFPGGDFSGAGGLTAVSLENSSEVEFVPLTGNPLALAYDPANDRLYVAEYNSNIVTVLNASSGRPVTSIPVGLQPDAVVYDGASGVVYVANGGSDNLTIINGSTETTVGSVSVGSQPVSGVFASANRCLYIANYGTHSLSVVNTSNDSVAATIQIGGNPTGISYDVANGNVYVASQSRQALSVVAITNNTLVGYIGVGGWPAGVTVDPENGYVYIANFAGQNLTVVNGTSEQVAGSIPVGSQPIDVAYDPSTASLEGSNFGSGTISFVLPMTVPTPTFPVKFAESGLPPGAVWVANLSGSVQISSNSTIQFTEPNGSFHYSISGVAGLVPQPSSGVAPVDGGPVNVNVTFVRVPPPAYQVEFRETGLRGTTLWRVALNGSEESSEGTSLVFDEPNGSYPFLVGSPAGYAASPASGSVPVEGNAASVSIVFVQSPPPIAVNFSYPQLDSCGGPVNASFTSEVSGGAPPYSYLWNFGDGTPSSTAADPTHEFSADALGSMVQLNVTDSVGATGNHTAKLEVLFPPCIPPYQPQNPEAASSNPTPWILYGILAGGAAIAVVIVAILIGRSRRAP